MMRRIVGGRVGPGRVGGVRQRHVAGAQGIHLPQRGERIVDLMAAFDSDERRNASGAMDALDVGGGVSHLQIVRIARDHAVDEIDLFDRHLHRAGPVTDVGIQTDQNCPPT